MLLCYVRRWYCIFEGVRLKESIYIHSYLLVKLFKIIHVPCKNTHQIIFSNSCTIVGYRNTHSCSKTLSCFGHCLFSSERYPTRKILHIYDITRHYCVFLVEYLSEGGKQSPKLERGLPYVCILLYLTIVNLLEYVRWYEIIFSEFR